MLRYLFCVLLAPVAIVAASSVHAADTLPAEQVNVTIPNTELDNPDRAGDVYARLVIAAHQACDVAPAYDPAVEFFNAVCREDALNDAVRHLDRPALTQLRQRDVEAASPKMRVGKR